MDLSGSDEKDGILSISSRPSCLEANQARPDDANWTGAEITSCCRLVIETCFPPF